MLEFNGQAEVEKPTVLEIKKDTGKKDLIMGLLFTIAIAGIAVLIFRRKETPKKEKVRTITKTLNPKGEIENEQTEENDDDDNGNDDSDDNGNE